MINNMGVCFSPNKQDCEGSRFLDWLKYPFLPKNLSLRVGNGFLSFALSSNYINYIQYFRESSYKGVHNFTMQFQYSCLALYSWLPLTWLDGHVEVRKKCKMSLAFYSKSTQILKTLFLSFSTPAWPPWRHLQAKDTKITVSLRQV